MADEADIAFDLEQRYLAQALSAQRTKAGGLRANGACHYCGNEEAIADRLFCDPDCASDWEYEFDLRRRLGLRAPVTGAAAEAAAA